MLPPISPCFSRCFFSGLPRHIHRGARAVWRALSAVLLCFLLNTILLSTTLRAAPPLTADTETAREGYFVLHWTAMENPGSELVLQQSSDADFSEFSAPDNEQVSNDRWDVSNATQFTQSGLDNGVYYFRLTDDSGVSNTVRVTVAHHSLARALFFFCMGLLLFLILVTMIIVGHRRTVLA